MEHRNLSIGQLKYWQMHRRGHSNLSRQCGLLLQEVRVSGAEQHENFFMLRRIDTGFKHLLRTIASLTSKTNHDWEFITRIRKTRRLSFYTLHLTGFPVTTDLKSLKAISVANHGRFSITPLSLDHDRLFCFPP
jgi:hypothetical protein